MKNKTVLFLCFYNSVRSPIAEGLLKFRCNGHYTVSSAGIAPIRVNPYAVKVMQNIGIDISDHKPASVFTLKEHRFDYIISFSEQAYSVAEEYLHEHESLLYHAYESPAELGRTPEEIMSDFLKLRGDINQYLDEIFPGLSPIKVF
jgi:arsenate reductase